MDDLQLCAYICRSHIANLAAIFLRRWIRLSSRIGLCRLDMLGAEFDLRSMVFRAQSWPAERLNAISIALRVIAQADVLSM